MFCVKCGNELKDGQLFCPKCGAKAVSSDTTINSRSVENSRAQYNQNKKEPDASKKVSIVPIIIITAIVVLLIGVLVNLFVLKPKKNVGGHFEKRDGIDTYVENGEVIKDTLVVIEDQNGKKVYYVDNEGHKIKNKWQVIDNDNNYGYFGNLGELVTDDIREIEGNLYYFDENGLLLTDRNITYDGVQYVADKNGVLTELNKKIPTPSNSKIVETTTIKATTKSAVVTTQAPIVAPTSVSPTISTGTANIGQAPFYTTETTVQKTTTETTTAKNTLETNADGSNVGPGQGITGSTTNSGPSDSTTTTDGEGSDTNIKIVSKTTIESTVDGEDYECVIKVIKATMRGKNDEETEYLNSALDGATDELMELVESYASEMSTTPKSITFTSVDITSITSKKIILTFTATLKQKTGSTRTLKYKMTYDREAGEIVVAKVSS